MVCSFHTARTVIELRRHSQQQMFSSPPLLVPYDTTCKTLYWVRWSARKSHTPGYDMYYANLTSLLLLCIKREKEREREKMKNEMLYIKSGLDYCTLYFLVGNSSPPKSGLNSQLVPNYT